MVGVALGGNVQNRRRAYDDVGREKDDFYRTPPDVTRALVMRERFSIPKHVWEPACGDGAISKVLDDEGYQVISTDLVDRGFGSAQRDFLMEGHALADGIVTNPPFKLADAFIQHAIALGVSYVAIFQRLAWLEGAKRRDVLYRPNPPARVYVFSARVTLWRGDEESPGKGGAIPFAWFVWDRANTDASTKLYWI